MDSFNFKSLTGGNMNLAISIFSGNIYYLLHDIRITEIHPETTRTNPSGTGFPALEAFHRLTVTAAGKTLQLHGFTVEGICCVYGIG